MIFLLLSLSREARRYLWKNLLQSLAAGNRVQLQPYLFDGQSTSQLRKLTLHPTGGHDVDAAHVAEQLTTLGQVTALGTVFDDDYCTAHGLLDTPPAPEPEVIGRLDEKEVTRWTRCTTETDPLALAGEPRADSADPFGEPAAPASAPTGPDETDAHREAREEAK